MFSFRFDNVDDVRLDETKEFVFLPFDRLITGGLTVINLGELLGNSYYVGLITS
jgi:hypothetical protein